MSPNSGSTQSGPASRDGGCLCQIVKLDSQDVNQSLSMLQCAWLMIRLGFVSNISRLEDRGLK